MAAAETSHWWYGATSALLQQILRRDLAPGGRFLDAGCGTGATGAWMAQCGGVVGVDREPLALTLYREGHADAGLAVADVARLPCAGDSFDAVLCVTVLCHRSLPSPEAAVSELVRVTRPGGVVCLLEPGVARLRRGHDRVTHTGRRFTRRGLAGLLESNGCDLIRSTGAYAFLVAPAMVKALLERGKTASDLDRGRGGVRGVLPRIAAAERCLLRHVDLPVGLSVIAVGRRRDQRRHPWQRQNVDRPFEGQQ